MASLSEKYRPKHFAAVVGQNHAVAQIQKVLARGWGGRSWWIAGASGTGKSTLAYIIAQEGADPFYIEELDAQLLTPARLKDVEDESRYTAMSAKRGKAYIVNEAHGLRKDTIRLLLVMLERLPSHVVFCFTTTTTGQQFLFSDDGDAAPLISRCTHVKLENGEETRKAMASRAEKIAKAEGIDGVATSYYLESVDQCRGNLRMLLSRIESGSFVDDAHQRGEWRRELTALADGKGKHAEKRRAELTELLAS